MKVYDTALTAEAARWYARMGAEDAEKDRIGFEAWLAADPAHRLEYERVGRAVALSGDLSAGEIYRRTPDLDHFARSRWLTLPRAALAASVAFALLVSAAILVRIGHAPEATSVVAAASEPGEIRTVSLPDGSAITLDTDSRIEARFAPSARRIRLLQGRARFDVKPDGQRKFFVEAGGREISADGALFDVQRFDTMVQVQSLRGLVTVGPIPTRPRFASYMVPARQRISLSDRDDAVRTNPISAGSERWVEGMLVYQAEPLTSVLADTNRYTRRPIVLADPALGRLKVTGAFRPVPVEALAEALAAALGLKAANQGEEILLSQGQPPD